MPKQPCAYHLTAREDTAPAVTIGDSRVTGHERPWLETSRARPCSARRAWPESYEVPRRGRSVVKVVVAVIRPNELDDVKSALDAVGVHGLTMTQVLGYGRQEGHIETYRDSQFVIEMLPKLRLEILIDDSQVGEVVDTVIEHARTGAVGDGKVWVQSVEDVVRIRTGEHGSDAV